MTAAKPGSIRQSVAAAMKREADRCDAMDELAKQLLRYEIRDLDAKQIDSERQFLADTVRNCLRWKLGVDRIYELAGLVQAAHMAAGKSL